MWMIDVEPIAKKIEYSLSLGGAGDYNSGYDAALNAVLDDINNAPTLTPPNEPLTLEELSGMSHTDWVWIVYPECPPEDSEWYWASRAYRLLSHELYGKTWIAYRRPPEGGNKT